MVAGCLDAARKFSGKREQGVRGRGIRLRHLSPVLGLAWGRGILVLHLGASPLTSLQPTPPSLVRGSEGFC